MTDIRDKYKLNEAPLMKCGCVAQGKSGDDWVCVIHAGIGDDNGELVAEEVPSLEGRTARCPSCKKENPSGWNLPFFQLSRYFPEGVDSFYCGCRGWD